MILNEKDRILRRKSIELKKVKNLKGLRVDTSVPHGREKDVITERKRERRSWVGKGTGSGIG